MFGPRSGFGVALRGRFGLSAAGGALRCGTLPAFPPDDGPLLRPPADGPGWARGVILLIPPPPDGDDLFLPLLPSPDCDDDRSLPIPVVDAASACVRGRRTIRNIVATVRHARTSEAL